MDAKCVRILRPYEETDHQKRIIYIDKDAKYSLMVNWGDKLSIKGKRDVIDVEVQPLKELDQEGFIARMGQGLLDEAYIEYGEEVMLFR